MLALRFEPYVERPSCQTFGSCPSWFEASEIFWQGRCYGAVHTPRYRREYDRPFDSETPPAHTRRTAEVADSSGEAAEFSRPVEWHAVSVRGDMSLLQLVGQAIEFWPEGLYAVREELPRLPSTVSESRDV